MYLGKEWVLSLRSKDGDFHFEKLSTVLVLIEDISNPHSTIAWKQFEVIWTGPGVFYLITDRVITWIKSYIDLSVMQILMFTLHQYVDCLSLIPLFHQIIGINCLTRTSIPWMKTDKRLVRLPMHSRSHQVFLYMNLWSTSSPSLTFS